MSEIAQQQALGQLLRRLEHEPQTLDELWHTRALLWQELGWDQAQLKVWLYCQPRLKCLYTDERDERFGPTESAPERGQDLGEEIARIIQSSGRPLPLAQLKNRLPAGLVATEPMLKAAIADHPGLQMLGPMVKLK